MLPSLLFWSIQHDHSDTVTVKPTKLSAKDNFPSSTFYNEPTKLNPISWKDGSTMSLQESVSEAFRQHNFGARYLISGNDVWECNGSATRMKLTEDEVPTNIIF